MTQVDFYVQVEDKSETVRKLCARALDAGAKLVVLVADHAAAQRLSRLLWSVPSTGFAPHCLATDALATRTPIILACGESEIAHDDILINLRGEVPPFFSRFNRLIEIVSSADGDDKRRARERFRFYRDRGYEIRTLDMTRPSKSASA